MGSEDEGLGETHWREGREQWETKERRERQYGGDSRRKDGKEREAEKIDQPGRLQDDAQ